MGSIVDIGGIFHDERIVEQVLDQYIGGVRIVRYIIAKPDHDTVDLIKDHRGKFYAKKYYHHELKLLES